MGTCRALLQTDHILAGVVPLLADCRLRRLRGWLKGMVEGNEGWTGRLATVTHTHTHTHTMQGSEATAIFSRPSWPWTCIVQWRMPISFNSSIFT
jgi:hypothetical protein